MLIVFLGACSSARVRRRGVFHAQPLKEQSSMRAPPPRVSRSTLLRVLLAPSVSNSTLDQEDSESQGDLLSIRGASQDRIAAYQIDTTWVVALQLTRQR